MTGYIGSFFPLAKNQASEKTGDDRPDFMTLYSNLDTDETRLTQAIDEITQAGWLAATRGSPSRLSGRNGAMGMGSVTPIA